MIPILRASAGLGPNGGYTPQQVLHAYGIDQIANKGAGQTIAIVDAYGSPTIAMDAEIFSQKFGLPSVNLQIIHEGASDPGYDEGWAVETSLDVEWVHAVAPLAKILLVVAQSPYDSDMFSAIDLAVQSGANVVSMSWGGLEDSTVTGLDSHFNVKGVTFVASTGDYGSWIGVQYPSTSPYVLAVGGTDIDLDKHGNVKSETAWNDDFGGGGGGISAYETRPSWQDFWVSFYNRGVPDVSYGAGDPGFAIYATNEGGWIPVGGTSAGAPQWAALIALGGGHGATFPIASNIYFMATMDYSAFFRDVTSGNNGWGLTGGGFNALPSWDAATGLGVPNASMISFFLGAY